jgi:phenylacetate-CoA ligase
MNPFAVRATAPALWDRVRFLMLGPRDLLLYLVCRTYWTFLISFRMFLPRILDWSGRVRARRAFFRAVRTVPAYASHVKQHGLANGVPETDKASYILPHAPECRCVNGRFPAREVMIDESSGSTGTPYNWIRTIGERHQSHLFISYFTRYGFGDDRWIVINGFSMGAWATGINMGEALQMNGIVKDTGPDIGKILGTLTHFGPGYPYMILGYPPFLKRLMDEAETRAFPLDAYRLSALVGGEGMSEGLRDYLLRRFTKVYSGYGATDLEIGLAGETPVSVAIRRLARDNPRVRARLFSDDPRLPMLFQYNPLMHYIEVNADREICITITRASVLSPRIRYNIHDEGGVARFDEIAARLAEAGADIRALAAATGTPVIKLPFLWIYGRRDFTISVMGANIYPEDLEEAIYSDPELARITTSFCQAVAESPSGDVRPCFHFEITAEPDAALAGRYAAAVSAHLQKVNADFREACREYPEALVPEIHLHKSGEGPFQANAGRIKQVRRLAGAR